MEKRSDNSQLRLVVPEIILNEPPKRMLWEVFLPYRKAALAVQRWLNWRRKFADALTARTAPLGPPPSLTRCRYFALTPVRCPRNPAVAPPCAPQPLVGMVTGIGTPNRRMSVSACDEK